MVRGPRFGAALGAGAGGGWGGWGSGENWVGLGWVGLVGLTEQLAEHWCPIQLNEEIQRLGDTPDHPVPLAGTFLLDPGGPGAAQPAGDPGPPPHGGRMLYTITLRVFKLDQQGGTFRFANDQFDPITEALPEGQRDALELARAGAG